MGSGGDANACVAMRCRAPKQSCCEQHVHRIAPRVAHGLNPSQCQRALLLREEQISLRLRSSSVMTWMNEGSAGADGGAERLDRHASVRPCFPHIIERRLNLNGCRMHRVCWHTPVYHVLGGNSKHLLVYMYDMVKLVLSRCATERPTQHWRRLAATPAPSTSTTHPR